jgi:dihydrofolate synthase/folylpolyglutamate synthase
MSYSELINRLVSTQLYSGMKLGLHNACQLSELLNNPHRECDMVHVAGTNGKGSVAYKIARVLELSGYRVGLYTSPHIASFRERIQINRQPMTQSAVETHLPPLFELAEVHAIPATFFELTTLLAFTYFASEKVDIAIIETGMGGRLDATNIIQPKVAAITSISLDHTKHLGETEESIALEKGGIAKPGVPLVLGPTACRFAALESFLAKVGAPVRKIAPVDSPFYDDENRAIAAAVLELLSSSYSISDHALDAGLTVRPPCRFEIFRVGQPSQTVVLDVAHNVAGFERFFQALSSNFPGRPVRLIVGLSSDKDRRRCLDVLAKQNCPVHFVQGAYSRAVPAKELACEFAALSGRQVPVHDTVALALREALNAAVLSDQVVAVCGTFYIMAEARAALGVAEPSDTLL